MYIDESRFGDDSVCFLESPHLSLFLLPDGSPHNTSLAPFSLGEKGSHSIVDICLSRLYMPFLQPNCVRFFASDRLVRLEKHNGPISPFSSSV